MTDDALVALNFGFIILAVTGLVAWFLALRFRRREMQHREWMAALEKGVSLPTLGGLEMGMGGPNTYLLKGLIWLACGLTLTVFLWGLWLSVPPVDTTDSYVRQVGMLREAGYSSAEIARMVGSSAKPRPRVPLGLSLIGLVPAGIGAAYLVFYRLEVRRAR